MVLTDVRLYREGLAKILAAETCIELVGSGPPNHETIAWVVAAQPNVVLLEAAVACASSIVHDLARLSPSTKIVAYGVQDEEQQALRCAEAGVAAFVMGEATGQELAGTILSLAQGEFRCPPRVAAMMVQRLSALSQGVREDQRHERLTSRERRIVVLIDEGLSNKEIARRLGISLATVKNHVHSILEKLDVPRRAQAAAQFRRTQLLDNPA